jgi:DNA-binding ferritin-like protein (Dps family)
MNNEARLRAALLKWRANLIPLDYINRLKQIRKGCKLFKLGLKKLHEKDILDNVKNLAKENKKQNVLQSIIIKLIPELAIKQMKRVRIIPQKM